MSRSLLKKRCDRVRTLANDCASIIRLADDCAVISCAANDWEKRELFARLAEHLTSAAIAIEHMTIEHRNVIRTSNAVALTAYGTDRP
jgi:hypothetical protein